MKRQSFDYARNVVNCRYCQSSDLYTFLKLGNQPPSNSFISAKDIKNEIFYPLNLCICQNCFLVQLDTVVSPKITFDDYLYLSSTSKALKAHYAKLAKYITTKYSLKKDDIIIDIGCNDGILLNEFEKNKMIRIGIEPSKVAKFALASGLIVYNDFFNKQVSKEIEKTHGKAKIITATNVFAHIDDIEDFLTNLITILEKNGTFIIEAPYLIDLMEQTLFDTIYHEHLSYLSITPLEGLFNKYGLEIYRVDRVPFGASGPAIRVFVGFMHMHTISKSVQEIINQEKIWGISKISNYLAFTNNVLKTKSAIWSLIHKYKLSKENLGGYGAPAKGNTLLNFFELSSNEISCIAETNELKQGLVTPGTHIPIVSEEEFLSIMPKFALLLSWNYLNYFLSKSLYIKNKGKFLVPIPKPRILP